MIFFLLTGAVRLLTLLATGRCARGRSASLAAVFAFAAIAAHGGAQAQTFGGAQISNCTYVPASKTYTCSALDSADTAVFVIPSGYTVIVSAPVNFAYNQKLTMSGTASLQSSAASINLAAINPASLNISGGTLVAKTSLAVGVKAITADLTADSLSTVSNSNITGSVTVKNAIALNSSTTIVGAVSAGSLSAGSSLKVTGQVSVTGEVRLESATTINGALSGSTIVTGSGSSFNGEINATTSFTLASAGKVVGNVTAPVVNILASPSTVTGDIKASTSLKLESGATVNGNVSGGSLQMDPSPVVINGNATMTGDVDIGSGDTINGNLTARNVMTRDSNVYIKGNAIVNAITLNYAAKVGDTIYCTAPGSVNCSCVTNNSGYGMPAPKCSAGPPPASGGPHHIQINHNGTALTCQPQTVSLIACANATCTTPHYTAAFSGTLSPGNLPFTIAAGNGTGTGLVQQTTTTPTASLSAASAATNPSTCVNPNNSTAPCAMTFSDKGLIVTVPDHVSMASGVLNIEALQAQNNNQSCVPLLKDVKRASVNIGCGFSDPTKSAAAGLTVTDRDGASVAVNCGSSTTSVMLDFDANGKTTATLKYPEVGVLAINAKYTSSATPAFYAVGNSSFTVAPFSIGITAVRVNSVPTLAAGVFARAGEPFKLTLTARNKDNNPTKNFGTESTKENFLISTSITNPTKNPKGEIKQASITAIKDGSSDSVWSFSDVGNIKMSASIAQDSTYYMNKLVDGFNPKAELTLGRFIPDHFDTMLPVLVTPPQVPAYAELPSTQLTGVTMKCANASSLNNPCAALDKVNGRFIYSKQPFYMVVKAYNMQSALTQNYSTDNGLAGLVELSSWKTAGGTASIGFMGWKNPTSTPKFSFVAGVGVVSVANLPHFDFGETVAVDPASIYVRAVDDADKVTSGRATGAVELPLTAVSGRMMVANNYGSQSSALPVEVQAQYWVSNAGGYVLNPAYYSDLQAVGTNRTFDNCKGLLNCGALTLKADKLTFVAGKATLQIAPPQAPGSANLTLNPAGTGWENFYLPSTTGRETFGIYRSGPVIYTREVHN